jgi:nitrogen-specific signal transduction histidine kinase
LGAALVESWKLDSFIADAILFQHAPADELQSSPILLKILAVASPLSSKGSARENTTFLEKAGKLFDLTEDTILSCLDQSIEKSTRMITDLGFSGRFYSADDAELFEEEQHNQNQQQLANAIQNIALGTTIGRSHKTEIIDFTKEIRASFSTLFNLDKILFFTVDEQQTTLYPVNDLEQSQLDEIELTLTDNNSLLVKTFHTKSAFNSLDEKCSVADKQTIRLLEAEVVYILPIVHDNTALGVLVLGVREREWPELQKKTDLLNFLSGEIADKYFSLHQKAIQPAGMSNADFRKIAHEISNPLTIINNYLYMLGKKIDAEHSAQEEIKFISEEIERVGSILLRAKDPAAPTKNKHRQVNINKLLNELDTLFCGSLYKIHQVKSTLLLDKQVPTLNCPKDKLKQILINIIKNGVEAMVDGGQMTISTRDNVYQNNQQFVEISLQDDGPGIDAKILKNLFQPVTSTKEGHSGLGLTIVNTLVQELSGHISCYSRQGEGTEFKILIPRHLPESEIELK